MESNQKSDDTTEGSHSDSDAPRHGGVSEHSDTDSHSHPAQDNIGDHSTENDSNIAGLGDFFPPTMNDAVRSASPSELQRLRLTQRFVNLHRFALLVESALLKADVSRDDGDNIIAAFSGGDNPGDSATLPGRRQLTRYLETAMQLFYDKSLPAVIHPDPRQTIDRSTERHHSTGEL